MIRIYLIGGENGFRGSKSRNKQCNKIGRIL